MARFNKWLSRTQPDQLFSEAARLAVEERLDAFWHYVRAAAEEPTAAETIHQLRVWSRRAGTALDVFHDVLPPRRARWFAKQAKRARRAAGEPRDLDVLAARLSRGDSRCDEILQRIQSERRSLEPSIEKLAEKLGRKEFKRRQARCLDKVRWRGLFSEPTFHAAACDQLQEKVEAFFTAADADLSAVEALHNFRIAGKQLRYSLEVFAGAFEPEFREQLYPRVEALQEKLGEINDHAAAAARIERWRQSAAQDETQTLQRLADAENGALNAARQRFLDWWTRDEAATLRAEFALWISPATANGQAHANGRPLDAVADARRA